MRLVIGTTLAVLTASILLAEPADTRPVVHRLAVLDAQCSQHVVKNGVKPYVAKAEVVHDHFRLRLAVVTN